MNAWLDLTATYLERKGGIDQFALGHHLWITIVWNSLVAKSLYMLYFVHYKGIQTLLVLRNGLILGVSWGYVLICNIWALGSYPALVAES